MSDISTQQSEEYCLDVSRLAVELGLVHLDEYFETTDGLQKIINYNTYKDRSHMLLNFESVWTTAVDVMEQWDKPFVELTWKEGDWEKVKPPTERLLSKPQYAHELLGRVVDEAARVLVAIANREQRATVALHITECQRIAYQAKRVFEEAWDLSKEAREESDA